MRRLAFFIVVVSSFPSVAASCLIAVASAKESQSDDTGLIKHTVSISMSHSVGWLRQKDKSLLQEKLSDEVYQEAVKQFGEATSEEAVFRIYLPKGAQHIRALFLISEHGVGGPMMEHRLLCEFADKHHMALIGVLGNPIQRGIYPASALDSIIEQIGDKVNHPELSSVPVFTFGHSNGTGFSALYAAMRPDRVVGWVSYQSGGSWHLVFPGVEEVPGLVMHAHQDKYFENGQEQAVSDLRVERNASVSLLVDGKSGHWPSDREATFALILDFCESCIRVRFPGGTLATDANMKPVSIEAGWLADRYDRSQGGMQRLNVALYGKYSGDKQTANWLPDEAFAKSWQRYAATGSPTEGNKN